MNGCTIAVCCFLILHVLVDSTLKLSQLRHIGKEVDGDRLATHS